MATKLTDDGEIISDINVVPLVDIILVVLIIFMVTAPMLMKPAIGVNLPKASHGDQVELSKLNISLSSDGRISLNGNIVDQEEIKNKAIDEFSKNPDIQAVISADKDVAHGRVVELMDLVKSTGIKKFAISIEKQ